MAHMTPEEVHHHVKTYVMVFVALAFFVTRSQLGGYTVPFHCPIDDNWQLQWPIDPLWQGPSASEIIQLMAATVSAQEEGSNATKPGMQDIKAMSRTDW